MEKYQIGKGRPEEYDSMIDFANMVFGEDFKRLLPKAYDNHPEIAQYHHVIRENGGVRAMVGSFPLVMHVGGETLSVGRIGTVSAHPYDRGRGYMTKLMPVAIEEARSEGTDMMALGGLRQRYEHFGFAQCGTVIQFGLIPENRKHCRNISTQDITLLDLEEHPEYILNCVTLQEQKEIYAERGEANFLEIARSWDCRVYVILNQGSFAGYCCYEQSGIVQELVLAEESLALPAAMKLLEQEKKELTFWVEFFETAVMCEFMKVSERYTQFSCPSFLIINYERVLKAFLGLKARTEILAEGSLVIDVQGIGRYEITHRDSEVSVCDTEKQADVSLPPLEMMLYLFAPQGAPLHRQSKNPIERSWLPIPLMIPKQDSI